MKITTIWALSASLVLPFGLPGYGQNDSRPDEPNSKEAKAADQVKAAQDESSDSQGKKEWNVSAPDLSFFAVGRIIPDAVLIQRSDLDGVAVAIYSDRENVISRHDFPRRLIEQMECSPDSKFLLFTTSSSGGHSPWHSAAFLYCAADKSFRDVEAAIGTVVSPEFRFEPPDVAIITVKNADAPEEEIKVPLGKTVDRMPRLK